MHYYHPAFLIIKYLYSSEKIRIMKFVMFTVGTVEEEKKKWKKEVSIQLHSFSA